MSISLLHLYLFYYVLIYYMLIENLPMQNDGRIWEEPERIHENMRVAIIHILLPQANMSLYNPL